MIDNPARVERLLGRREGALPLVLGIPPPLAVTIQGQAPGMTVPGECQVTWVSYAGDEAAVVASGRPERSKHRRGYVQGRGRGGRAPPGSTHLIRRIVQSWPLARAWVPGLWMIVVAGPRIPSQTFAVPPWVEVHTFLPDLDRHLTACDIALVRGGLTTCMELTAAGTPFIYFPLQNHFEQNFHVAHRLDRYGAGRRLTHAAATPETIAGTIADVLRAPAVVTQVEAGGAARAAAMLAELF